MRITIIGAHGVGKTNLSKKLSEQLNLPVIHDVVVEAFQKGFEINETTPFETQFWLFAKQLEVEKNTINFVADKCLIDYSVYADVLFDDDRVKSLLSEMIKKNIRYDYVFYLPIEFTIEDDGIRSTNIEFQKKVDERYLELIRDWSIDHTILTGSVEDRLSQAMAKIANSNS